MLLQQVQLRSPGIHRRYFPSQSCIDPRPGGPNELERDILPRQKDF
jgi:hypothetical protein